MEALFAAPTRPEGKQFEGDSSAGSCSSVNSSRQDGSNLFTQSSEHMKSTAERCDIGKCGGSFLTMNHQQQDARRRVVGRPDNNLNPVMDNAA